MPPRAGLTRAGVVQAAAELADREGLEALTLNRLAAQLGVQPPSLYNHVNGLGGLRRELALLSARELGARLARAVMGQSGPQGLRALAQAYRAYILEHPGVYAAGVRGADPQAADGELAEAQGRVVEAALAVVISFGLRDAEGIHAVRILRSAVHGFATLEAAGGFGLPLDCEESFRRLVETLIRGMEGEGPYPRPLP